MLGARLEQQRVVGKHRHRIVQAVAVPVRHGVVVVAADTMDAGNVAHQLSRGDCPLLLGIRRDVSLHGRVQVEAPAVVQKCGRNRRQRF
jgi:hypothetical protein